MFLLFPILQPHAGERRGSPFQIMRGAIAALPALHELAQPFHHRLLFLADRRPAERVQEILARLVFQRFSQNRREDLIRRRHRARAFEQVEFSAGQAEFVLEAAHHLGEKAVHRPQREPRQGAHHAFQRLAEIRLRQRQIPPQPGGGFLLAGGGGELRQHRVRELAGGLAGERERHDFLRSHAARHQADHPVRELEGFPGAGGRENEQVRGEDVHRWDEPARIPGNGKPRSSLPINWGAESLNQYR